jgi:hypothetical protein
LAIRDADSDMPAIVFATALVSRAACRRHDARHQPRAVRLLGVHVAAGQNQVHRLGLADSARQPLRATHTRQHTELDLGLAELRGVSGDEQIAHHRQLAAAAQRVARDRSDGRGAGGGELGPLRE